MSFYDLINGTDRLDASFYVLNALAAIVYYRHRSVGGAGNAITLGIPPPPTRSSSRRGAIAPERTRGAALVADRRGSALSDVGQALLDGMGQRVTGRQDPLTANGGVAKQGYRVSYPAH